ncbi:MAG: AbrB/MazE/SpoVT family DNA-binding domain-containing protein [bacterium]
MVTTIQKWGNSLGLRIPKGVAEDAHVKEGTPVEIRLQGGRLVISPVKSRRYRLDDLLKSVTRHNLHHEVNTGDAVGKEAW